MTLLKNMRITHKISALMVGLVLGFILIGTTYYVQVSLSENARAIEKEAYRYQALLGELDSLTLRLQIRTQVLTTQENISDLYNTIQNNTKTILAFDSIAIDKKSLNELTSLVDQHKAEVARLRDLKDAPVEEEFHAFMTSEDLLDNSSLSKIIMSMRNLIDTLGESSELYLATISEKAASQAQITQAAVTGIIFMVAMATAVGVYLLYKSIVFPLVHMQSVIRRINRGKSNARVKILSQDELGDLGVAFNKLFNERINQLEEQSKENDKLNNSIISLIQALGAIANKDLTVKVPVSSDITGTISDAVNLLTSETAQTLKEVKDISHKVNDVSNSLQEQSQIVMQFADNERRHIVATSKALTILANAMNEVATRSKQANTSAAQAIENTRAARGTVNKTVSSIRAIRETISETEKRMKRLGERSQEVSGIVNLINTIAERTHILALNASMHAASAGEAGKGFAVVADEVQRLAESARTSTEEISTMVNNMRVETADTAAVMNTLISQVAEGSRMAEDAEHQMADTEHTTEQLVKTVEIIATQAIQQADVANRVKERSAIIRGFTEKTEKQLQEQHSYTENLKLCSETLVQHVNVFSLPSDAVIQAPTSADDNIPTLVSVG